jgi:phosphoserine aminotransferase
MLFRSREVSAILPTYEQISRVKNVAKGEDVIKENTHQTYAFVDEFLEEAMKSSSLYEADQDVDYEYWSLYHDAHATLSISNSLHNKYINLLHLPEKYHISILDGGAETCVLRTRMGSSFCS